MISLIFEDFKNHKLKYLSYLFLIILILVMQTYISFLKNDIETLESKLTISSNLSANNIQNSTQNVESSDDMNYKNTDKNENEIDTDIKSIKNSFIKFGKEKNKEYINNLEGKEVCAFECFDLKTVQDSHVKNCISKLTKDKFNIKFETLSVSNKVYYKIRLYE